jgi:hypothetical protein
MRARENAPDKARDAGNQQRKPDRFSGVKEVVKGFREEERERERERGKKASARGLRVRNDVWGGRWPET